MAKQPVYVERWSFELGPYVLLGIPGEPNAGGMVTVQVTHRLRVANGAVSQTDFGGTTECHIDHLTIPIDERLLDGSQALRQGSDEFMQIRRHMG